MSKLEDIRPKLNQNRQPLSREELFPSYDKSPLVKIESASTQAPIPAPIQNQWENPIEPTNNKWESELPAKNTPVSHDNVEFEIKDRSSSGLRIWLLAGISIMGLLIAASFFFAKAIVIVHPKIASVILDNEVLSAKSDAVDAEIPFEVMVLSGDLADVENTTEAPVVKTETKPTATQAQSVITNSSVSSRGGALARGKVVIFNKSATSVKLKEETRLETTDGKIYKTDIAVVVPASSKKGSEIIPGSIEVGVHAENWGDSYNIGLSDFIIFGFKGTAREKTTYARSKTEISGGVNESGAQASSQSPSAPISSAYDKLYKRAIDETPEGFVFFDDGVFFDAGRTIKSDSTPLVVPPKLSVLIFNKEKLSKAIARSALRDFDDGKIIIPDFKQLAFKIQNKESVDPAVSKEISFSLSGQTNIVWLPDASLVERKLVNIKKKEFNEKMQEVSGIDMAELTVRPFWLRRLPESVKDIDVKIIP